MRRSSKVGDGKLKLADGVIILFRWKNFPELESLILGPRYDRLGIRAEGEVQNAAVVPVEGLLAGVVARVPDDDFVLFESVRRDKLLGVFGVHELADLGVDLYLTEESIEESIPDADGLIFGATARDEDTALVRGPVEGADGGLMLAEFVLEFGGSEVVDHDEVIVTSGGEAVIVGAPGESADLLAVRTELGDGVLLAEVPEVGIAVLAAGSEEAVRVEAHGADSAVLSVTHELLDDLGGFRIVESCFSLGIGDGEVVREGAELETGVAREGVLVLRREVASLTRLGVPKVDGVTETDGDVLRVGAPVEGIDVEVVNESGCVEDFHRLFLDESLFWVLVDLGLDSEEGDRWLIGEFFLGGSFIFEEIEVLLGLLGFVFDRAIVFVVDIEEAFFCGGSFTEEKLLLE